LEVEIERSTAPDSRTLGTTSAASVTAAEKSKVAGTKTPQLNRQKLIIGLALLSMLVVAVVVAASWSRWDRSSQVEPAPAAVAVPQRSLSYWMTVQKYRDGRSFEDPFRLAGEINFEKDYRIRLHFSSPQAGYLYVLNESPEGDQKNRALNVLFPSPTANNGAALIAAGQEIQIPEKSEFRFDEEQGTEKIWLIWSAQSIAELDAAQRFANTIDKNEITDTAVSSKIREFLRAHSTSAADVKKDADKKETSLTAQGQILVHSLNLEHH